MELTYGELEDLLAALHAVHHGQRGALQGRIKHFQRNGWPGGTNTGKGRAARYAFGPVIKLAVGFELLELGITPERATRLLSRNWDYAATAISLAFSAHQRATGQPFDVVVYCDPSSLARLGSPDDADPADETFFYTSSAQIKHNLIDNLRLPFRRLAIVNLTNLLTAICDNLNLSWERFNEDYRAWDRVERPEGYSLDLDAQKSIELQLKSEGYSAKDIKKIITEAASLHDKKI